mmetsp:Transcript_1956/g.4518  ORF Transcript_1956/g.4518 Transcript_1956/m.4518 type:complete len:266 (-) Transcript_1956:1001-1798(-)
MLGSILRSLAAMSMRFGRLGIALVAADSFCPAALRASSRRSRVRCKAFFFSDWVSRLEAGFLLLRRVDFWRFSRVETDGLRWNRLEPHCFARIDAATRCFCCVLELEDCRKPLLLVSSTTAPSASSDSAAAPADPPARCCRNWDVFSSPSATSVGPDENESEIMSTSPATPTPADCSDSRSASSRSASSRSASCSRKLGCEGAWPVAAAYKSSMSNSPQACSSFPFSPRTSSCMALKMSNGLDFRRTSTAFSTEAFVCFQNFLHL